MDSKCGGDDERKVIVIVWFEDCILLTRSVREEKWGLIKPYKTGRDSRRMTARRGVRAICGTKPETSRVELIKELGSGPEMISIFEVRLMPVEAEPLKEGLNGTKRQTRLFLRREAQKLLATEDAQLFQEIGLSVP